MNSIQFSITNVDSISKVNFGFFFDNNIDLNDCSNSIIQIKINNKNYKIPYSSFEQYFELLDEQDETQSNISNKSGKTDKSKTSTQDSENNLPKDFINVDGFMKRKDEINDKYIKYSDKELVECFENLVKVSKKYSIEEYFKYKEIEHRPLTLTGLYSRKCGIRSDKQRYNIRELCRLCETFLMSDYVESKRKSKTSSQVENQLLDLGIKKEKETEIIIDYDKVCTLKIRNQEKCLNFCVEGKNYCLDCSKKINNL